MAAIGYTWEQPITDAAISGCDQTWYAVQTRARHERVVVERFREKGLTTFLPLVTEIRRWSDRKKVLELPLFSCYVFVKIVNTNEDRLRVLSTESVFDFVGLPRQGTPIPDEQIDAVRTIVEERLNWQSHPFLKIGQRVRIRGGALDGIEGILLDRNGRNSLVISVDLIQRSMAIRIDGYSVVPV
ncbi:MAG: UpxY family transcription antiterminator [Candidatus Sulfotelmatobacter sp.]